MDILQDDEYAVYNANQQRIRYLVEFTASGDPPPVELLIPEQEMNEVECHSTESQQKGLFYNNCDRRPFNGLFPGQPG